jgi:hypothetical protein
MQPPRLRESMFAQGESVTEGKRAGERGEEKHEQKEAQ